MDDFASKEQALFLGYLMRFGKVAPHFGKQVDKADDDMVRITFQGGGHLLKGAKVVVQSVSFGDKNRIVAPGDGVAAHHIGKCPKILKKAMFVRHVGLNVAAVGGDGHVPGLPILF